MNKIFKFAEFSEIDQGSKINNNMWLMLGKKFGFVSLFLEILLICTKYQLNLYTVNYGPTN